MTSSKQKMLILSYNGLIEEPMVSSLINSITRQVDIISDKKVHAVLVSLKGAKYEEGVDESIHVFIKKLNELSKKLKIIISFIDYSVPLYKHLKTSTKNTQLKLFKNINAARVFLDPKSYKNDLHILVYDEDEENSKELSKELAKYGYTVARAKNSSEFEELVKSYTNDIVITHSSLNAKSDYKNTQKGNLALSKKLIVNLPVFMDTAVETLVSFTGLEAEKSSHSIKSFDLALAKNINCAVMHFKGDLDGSFVLLFPIDITLIAMESLLGEKIDENDNASIMDGIGEFCNVITGATKTAFASKDIKVVFDLPKTYSSPEEMRNDIGNNNGVWIDMKLAGKPFYMFITK